MTPKVQLYNFCDQGKAWDTFVMSNLASTNYHQFRWGNVIEKSFGHKAYYLCAMTEAGEICGILPLVHIKSKIFGSFLVSLPFFNYGGLLCDEGNSENAFMEKARDMLSFCRADFVELRHFDAFHKGLETKQHKVTMILDLERNVDDQWKALDPKVRNQIRKAEKSGLTTVSGQIDQLDGFYEVFCRNMRDLGTPVYGKNFFRNILETFQSTTRIISVFLDGKVIASGLLTWFRGTLEVPWASSVGEYREKCPNNLLYWDAIRFSIENGFDKFDFGRSTQGEGTFRFKKQWGAKPVQLNWQYILTEGCQIPELNPANSKFRLAIKVWQRLPLAITNAVGPMIVKNIP